MKLNEESKYFKAGLTVFLTALACLVCFFILYHLKDIFADLKAVLRILQPFLYGGIIAYLLTPCCRKVEKWLNRLTKDKHKKLSAALAVVASLLFGAALLAALLMIVVPQVWASAVSLANVLPGQIKTAYDKLYQLFDNLNMPRVQAWIKDVAEQTIAKVESWSKTDLLPTATTILSGMASYMSNIFVLLKDVLVGLVIAVYLLAARKQFAAQSKLVIRGVFNQKWVDRIEDEVRYVDRMFNGFFMGKILDAVVVGLLCFAGCLILGLPSAPLISVIVGVTNIIPMFGPFIGAIPCALLLLLENPMHCLTFIIFTVILQQLDGNVIGPRIMGDKTGLSGFWVTFAIVLFGGFWGISGMLVGVPLFAAIYDLIRRLVYKGLRNRGRQDMITAYNADFHPQRVIKPLLRPVRLPGKKYRKTKG